MKEDTITRILDRNNLNEAFKNVEVNKGYSIAKARGLAYCRKGHMFILHSKILQNAITKEGLQNPNKS